MGLLFEAHAADTTAKPLRRKLTSRSDEGAKRRAVGKKKARQKTDAPSNKTYGNCLLGIHCSHKDRPENRANA